MYLFVRLFGKIDSYFGMAIASAGDINMDGINDIAIGAPGENGWSGVVYLYLGDNSADSIGVGAKPSQVFFIHITVRHHVKETVACVSLAKLAKIYEFSVFQNNCMKKHGIRRRLQHIIAHINNLYLFCKGLLAPVETTMII